MFNFKYNINENKNYFLDMHCLNIPTRIASFLSVLSPEFKLSLIGDAFGSNPSEDAIIIFNTFALVVGLLVIGVIFNNRNNEI